MNGRDPDPAADAADGEPVLRRWSRLKTQARDAERAEAQARSTGQATAPVVAPEPAPTGPAAPGEPPRVELPDLDSMDQDSDYSAFLAPGVEQSLRQQALRKLFASPKFNVFDGLDTYRDDFTSFPALGDIVTADMRYQAEQLARKALSALEQDSRPAVGTGDAAAEVSLASSAPAAPAVPEECVPDSHVATTPTGGESSHAVLPSSVTSDRATDATMARTPTIDVTPAVASPEEKR